MWCVADDLVLLYVFWELTSVCSYLLIGHRSEQRASRRAATQALLVTTLGGLAMLVGIVMLGTQAGTYRWSEIAARPPPGGAYLATALVLVLLGAFAKSAIFPSSFWLPAAMAAPTPVSAYLHAAAMVKAGVYLVALLAPVYADVGPWRPVLLVAGAGTMLFGGWTALRQTDLKLLLAYGTVSQLGLLMVLVGAGTRTPRSPAARCCWHTPCSRRRSSSWSASSTAVPAPATSPCSPGCGGGCRRSAWSPLLAAASMAGVPPLVGFVAKEAVFAAFAGHPPGCSPSWSPARP